MRILRLNEFYWIFILNLKNKIKLDNNSLFCIKNELIGFILSVILFLNLFVPWRGKRTLTLFVSMGDDGIFWYTQQHHFQYHNDFYSTNLLQSVTIFHFFLLFAGGLRSHPGKKIWTKNLIWLNDHLNHVC